MNQSEMILSHLKRRGTITPMQALGNYGCFRLAARVKDLRTQGHRIETEMRTLPNGKRIAAYRLHT